MLYKERSGCQRKETKETEGKEKKDMAVSQKFADNE